MQISLHKKNLIRLFALSIIVFLGISFDLVSNQEIIRADQPPNDWVFECERRNLLYGCACKCRQRSSIGIREGLPGCTLGEANPVTGNTCNPTAFYQCNATGWCTEAYNPGSTSASSTSLGITNFFPLGRDGGLFKYGDDGNLNLTATIAEIVKIILWIAGAIAILLVFFGIYLYSTAIDNEEQLERAKRVFISSILGLIIIVIGIGVVTAIQSLTGFTTDSLDEQIDSPGSRDDDEDANFFRKLLGF